MWSECAIYILKIGYIKNGVVLIDAKEIAFIMDKMRSIDIDDEFDFDICEYMINYSKMS